MRAARRADGGARGDVIASTIGQIKLVQALRDVGLILTGMLLILVPLILFPKIALWLPRLIAPKFL